MTRTGSRDAGRHALDTDLIHRSLAGDREAAAISTTSTRRWRSRTCAGWERSPGEIEDACQEVFLRFFRHLAAFRGEAELKTWLFRLCVTEARRARERGAGWPRWSSACCNASPPRAPCRPRSGATPTIQKLIARAVDRMAPAQRDAFIRFGMRA